MPQSAVASVRHGQPALGLHVGDEQHVRTVGVEIEPLVHVLAEHGRRERPERFPELDLQVHHRLHLRRARVADDRAAAERARTELHASEQQTDHLLGREQRSHLVGQRRRRQAARLVAVRLQEHGDFVVAERRAEVRTAHAVGVSRRRARWSARARRALPGAGTLRARPRLLEVAMPEVQRHAQGAAGVTRRRLDPDLLERALAKDPAVADAVQRDAASQAEVAHARFRAARTRSSSASPLR